MVWRFQTLADFTNKVLKLTSASEILICVKAFSISISQQSPLAKNHSNWLVRLLQKKTKIFREITGSIVSNSRTKAHFTPKYR